MNDYEQELEKAENELAVIDVKLQELLEQKDVLVDRISELKAIINQQKESKVQKSNKTWDGTDFPWTEKLEQILKNKFKLSSLRPMQRQTMNATLSKEDCLLIMPTGGGKSLCFQLPALVDKGLTLVVSPLVSLMEDQQIALEQLGISSAMLNASTGKERLKYVQDSMVKPDGSLKMLYVTPEKLAKSKRFMNRLEKCYAVGNLDRIVIDEVHCCSQWGHDFRPDYKFLGIMKRQFPNAPILGLTATATVKVLEDVKKILNIPKALLFKASFNRPNLYFEVCEKPSTHKEIMDVIYKLISQRFSGQSGIVYCFTRKDSEEVTADLQSRGIKAGCYNADVDASARSTVHRKWLAGNIQVVVATVAFGMGIDKPDVRFVIHHSLSKSMENLYQESGRAGRDQKRSDCILFYRLADVVRQSTMVFTEMTGLHNLHAIVKYCTDVGSCRRSLIARHFGEVWDVSDCNSMCDHCDKTRSTGSIVQKDITKYCVDVLSILKAASEGDQRVTSAKLTDAWYGRGHASLKVKSVTVPAFGRETAERILAHMLINEYLQEDFHFTAYSTICYIVPGSKAKFLQNSAAKVFMDCRNKSSLKDQAQIGSNPQSTASTSNSLSTTSTSTKSSNSSSSFSTSKQSSSISQEKKKPKLVVVNKKFKDSNISVNQQASIPEQAVSFNSSVTNNSQSNSHEKSRTTKTVAKKNKLDGFNNDDFNFDDSDEGNFKQRPKKARTKENENHVKSGRLSHKERKKKFCIDDDDDDFQLESHNHRSIKDNFEDTNGSMISTDHSKQSQSIVISDEEDCDSSLSIP